MDLYRGIVVDNNHPDKNGKCRVKLFDFHPDNSDDFNKIDVEGLPWAEVMGSVELGLNSGVGMSSVPRQGTMVWCTLEGDDPNRPIIMGTSTGVPTQHPADDKTGFSDPDNQYPKSDRLGIPDTHPLVQGADNYTELTVIETVAGHVIEVDTRIKITHASGTIIEIESSGKTTVTCVNDIDVTATGNIGIHADGNLNLSANGDITSAAAGSHTISGSPVNIN